MCAVAGLTLRRDFFGDPAARRAYAVLIDDVFEIDVPRRDALCGADPSTRPFAYFDGDGACAASAEFFTLPMRVGGTLLPAAALRLVAVAPAWRGCGLFRALMERLLAHCDAHGGLALLYAEHIALYTRFGFRLLPQHRRVGPPPSPFPLGADVPRRLDIGRDEDRALLSNLLERRTPVSDHVAVAGGAALFLSQIADAALDYLPSLDTIVVSEDGADAFTLIDVVAPRIPPLATMLAALNRAPARVAVLFPTDKLAWSGTAEAEDTGLMVRGVQPPAFREPFMLPPTTGF